ncbi:MAG: tRNA uridine-5-carboxymethylaminomethyl(34) synthesis GTPase MnmE [Candidatus Coproplasma sp.]
MLNPDISAISTPRGTGGVAIIRISGANPLGVAEKMFVPSGGVNVADFEPYKMYTGRILCDGFEDFGMCVYFRAPKSFTGEDVVELHCHGGEQIARGVLKATFANGARAAERGEFTKRAFLNGKLSLASAEGMIDMINAESLAEIRAGGMMYSERLTKEVKKVQSALTDVLAGIAADVDYPEEDVAETELFGVKDDLNGAKAVVDGLISSYSCGKKIKSGVTVALCGAPNVGKSSLLNALLGYDKAIVSDVAGTTRDAVEGTLEIDGVKYNLYDTAGLRERADKIEAVGIEKARDIMRSADIVLFVSDGDNLPPDGVDLNDARVVKILNKCDIVRGQSNHFDLCVSAVTGENLNLLKELLSKRVMNGRSLDGAFIIEERHHAALCRASVSLDNAVNAIGLFPLDLIALDINDAWSALGEITGETANEEIISAVFAKFCVGK